MPALVSAVRNADKSVTLTFSVGNSTSSTFRYWIAPRRLLAPGVILTSASLGTVHRVPTIYVGYLATNPTLGNVLSGSFN